MAIPDEVRQFGTAIVGHMKVVDAFIDQAPNTLAPGDYRLDNMLFGSLDGESVCWVIDWEDVFFGSGMGYDYKLAHAIGERFVAAAQRLHLLELMPS